MGSNLSSFHGIEFLFKALHETAPHALRGHFMPAPHTPSAPEVMHCDGMTEMRKTAGGVWSRWQQEGPWGFRISQVAVCMCVLRAPDGSKLLVRVGLLLIGFYI